MNERNKKLENLYTWNDSKQRYFIDYDKVFSRNAKIYFIFGEKSLGKTFGMTGYLYHHWKKTGRNFVYLRRRKTEWATTRTNIFTDYFKKMGIKMEVTYQKYMLYIREQKPPKIKEAEWKHKHPWKFFGGTYPLEDYGEVQGLAFESVDTIFLDEFMIYNKQKRWIPNEADALQNISQTVFRDNVKKYNCKTVACSNAGGMTNPYFIAYDVQPRDFKQSNFIWRNQVLFINCPYSQNDNEFIRDTATNSYKDFAVNNNFLDDTDLLVLPKPPKYSTPLFSIYVTNDKFLTIFKAPQNFIFVGLNINENVDRYAINRRVQNVNGMYNQKVAKYLNTALDNRQLFFANSFVKNLFMQALN